MKKTKEIIKNFKIIKIDDLSEYEAVGITYEHIVTKMQVYFIKNKDTELSFTFAFHTPVDNDMGLSHIIEHSVLSGSKKYRVKDPFKTVGKGSVNTFLNAMTFSDFTLYPAASPLEQDFKHLFSLYSDSVFSPLLTKEIFWQEGIRLVLEPKPHFEGVVFSEMTGDRSDIDGFAANTAIRALYKDTYYKYESGGDTLAMTNLRYQDFLDFYKNYYHPSNCKLIMYGDIEDISYYLDILDKEYLKGKSYQETKKQNKVQMPFKKQLDKVIEVEKTGKNEDDCLYVIGYSTTNNSEAKNILEISILVDILLGNPGSPLYKAIIDSKLAQDLYNYSGMITDIYQMPVLLGFSNIKKENIEKAKNLINDTLKKIVKEHLDPILVKGAIRRQKFSLYEQSSGLPKGINLTLRALRAAYDDREYTSSLYYDKAIKAIDIELESNPHYFETLIKKYFIDNAHSVALLVEPTFMAKDDREKAIDKQAQKRFNEIKDLDKYTKELKDFDKYELEEDKKEDIDSIPLLKIEELPKTIKEDRLISNGKYHYILSDNKDIIYNLYSFDASDFSCEEALLLPLFARLIKLSGPKGTNYQDFIKEMNLFAGSYNTNIEEGNTLENNKIINLQIIFKALVKYNKEATIKIFDLITNIDLDNKERIKATIDDLKATYKSNIYGSPHYYAIIRSTYLNTLNSDSEFISGLSQWRYISSLNVDDTLVNQLKAIKSKLIVQERVNYYMALKDEYKKETHDILADLDSKLDVGTKSISKTRNYNMEVLPYVETMGNVSYQSFSFFANLEHPYNHISSIATKILSTELLWNELRMKGGAYGAGTLYDIETDLVHCYTYRDPNLSKSTDTIKKCITECSKAFNSRELYDAKVQYVGGDLKPLLPASELSMSYKRHIYKINDALRQDKRNVLLSCDLNQLRECGKLLSARIENGKVSALASKEMLKDNNINKEQIEILPW